MTELWKRYCPKPLSNSKGIRRGLGALALMLFPHGAVGQDEPVTARENVVDEWGNIRAPRLERETSYFNYFNQTGIGAIPPRATGFSVPAGQIGGSNSWDLFSGYAKGRAGDGSSSAVNASPWSFRLGAGASFGGRSAPGATLGRLNSLTVPPLQRRTALMLNWGFSAPLYRAALGSGALGMSGSSAAWPSAAERSGAGDDPEPAYRASNPVNISSDADQNASFSAIGGAPSLMGTQGAPPASRSPNGPSAVVPKPEPRHEEELSAFLNGRISAGHLQIVAAALEDLKNGNPWSAQGRLELLATLYPDDTDVAIGLILAEVGIERYQSAALRLSLAQMRGLSPMLRPRPELKEAIAQSAIAGDRAERIRAWVGEAPTRPEGAALLVWTLWLGGSQAEARADLAKMRKNFPESDWPEWMAQQISEAEAGTKGPGE